MCQGPICVTIRGMSPRQSHALLVGLLTGLGIGCGDSNACPPGSDGCPCEANTCSEGLICIEGWCQAGQATASASGTTGSTTEVATVEPSSGATGDETTADASTGDTEEPTTTAGEVPMNPVYVGHIIGELGEARDIEYTPGAQLAVVGVVERMQYDKDAWLGVYDTIESLAWERTFDGEDGADDAFNGVAVDAAGNITATGKQDLSVGWDDVLTVTWDSQGNELHVRGYGNEFLRDDLGFDTAVDAEGNVYVCGRFTYMDNFDGNQLAYTERYADVSGTSWRKYSGLLEDVQYDCETGPGGYLVTAGVRSGFTSLHRFAPDGDTVYRVEYNFPNASSTIVQGLAIDPEDEAIYVTGYATGFPGAKPWVGKWDWAGDKVWAVELTSMGDTSHARDLVLDQHGWLRVVGDDRVDGAWSLVITSLDTEGVEHARIQWAPANEEVRSFAIATRGDALVVAGATGDGTSQSQPHVLLAEFSL